MGRFVINTALSLVFVIMLFSLYKVLSGRAQEDTNIEKLRNVYNSELSLNKKLNSEYQYYTSSEYIEKVSRDNLNLAKKGEYILVLPSPTLPVQPGTKSSSNTHPSGEATWQQWVDLLIN